MAATATVLASGETLGGYRILDVIGVGGMAIVYRAEQISLGREVALKVLALTIADDEAFRERFRREGKHIATLDHPNIIAVYDSGEVDGRLFLAMRLVRGETLAQRMRAGGLTADQSLDLLTPIADALDAAGAARLVHRDVKPQNILINGDGHPYLADFGVAKGATTSGATATAGFVGTYNYAAPEQVLGRPITPAVDIYGLTAVLYQCFTGQLPFSRDTDAAVLHAHVYDPPPSVDPDQPGAARFNRLIERGMAKQPAERFESAGELIREAGEVVAALPASRRRISPTFVATSTRGDGDSQSPPGTLSEPAGDPMTAASGETADGAPSRPKPRPTGRRRWRAVGFVAALLVIAAGVVALAGGGSSAVRTGSTVSAPPFTIRYARPWRAAGTRGSATVALAASQARSTAEFSAVSGSRPIQLVSGDVTLSAGRLARSAPVPGGVPPALLDRYGPAITSANAQTAGHEGRRYTWSPAGGLLVAYVLPVVTGDGAIICRAPVSAIAVLSTCGLLAEHAAASSAGIVAPGPDRRLARAIRGPLETVLGARSALKGLAGGTFLTRDDKAATFSRTELRAAAILTHLGPPPRYQRAVQRLVAALKHEAAAFSALAAAGRSSDAAAYARGVLRVSAASRSLASLTDTVAVYQLAIPHFAPVHLAPAPANRVTSAGTAGQAQTSSSTATSPSGSSSPPPLVTTTTTGPPS